MENLEDTVGKMPLFGISAFDARRKTATRRDAPLECYMCNGTGAYPYSGGWSDCALCQGTGRIWEDE